MDDKIVVELSFDEFHMIRTALLMRAFELDLKGSIGEAAEHENLRYKLIDIWESNIREKLRM